MSRTPCEDNVLAATVGGAEALNQVYNVAVGERTPRMTLSRIVPRDFPRLVEAKPNFRELRKGDAHRQAGIRKAARLMDHAPTRCIGERVGAGDAVVCPKIW